ncbi:MAG: hypothetical protein IJS08_13335 [Victivallales bacterium]|nr:hypothetical protein [Victivallales bacterium]
MPDGATHSRITQCALECCGLLAAGDNSALVHDYCRFPDEFYGPRRNEIAPYTFMKDGIQFHYPPHTPYEEAYRYWNADENGRLFHSHTFINHNFEFMLAGFQFHFSRIIACLRNNEKDEARKFLGCLVHTLEDSTFGLHALEGPGGADAFVLDRMADSSDFPVRPSYLAARINSKECHATNYVPRSLGRTADEASMRLYAEYVAYVADSRKSLFSFILKANGGDMEACRDLNQRMFDNAVKITADAIWTVFAIADGKNATPPPCPLTDMEPHVFPFGGFRPYRYTAFERNYAVNLKDERVPLKLLLPEGPKEFSQGLSFGTHAEGELLFWIAPGSFDATRLKVGFHPDLHFGKASLQIINDGAVVEEVVLDEMAYTTTINPRNLFGLRFTSNYNAGCICVVG